MSGLKNTGVILHQVQYRFRGRPTRARLEEVRRLRQEGKPLPAGVKIKMIRWVGGLSNGEAYKIGEPQQAGIVKMYGDSRSALLDIDSRQCPSLEKIWRLARLLAVRLSYIRIDRTRHGWHVIIRFRGRSFERATIVAIQACLGSDLKRETYNLARVLSGHPSRRWNLLFETKL